MTGILRAFYLNEDDIDSFKSILLLMSTPSNIVYFLSALLYLFTGNEFSNQNIHDTDTISKAKREAISDFARERISEWSDKHDALEKSFLNIKILMLSKNWKKPLKN